MTPLRRLSLPTGLITSMLLAGCAMRAAAKQPAMPPPPGPHVRLTVEASKTTHYQMLCNIRTYEWAPEQYANRYGVDTTGPFSDLLLSPHAHCTAKIVSGPPPLRITLSKPGSTQSMTVSELGDAGKKTLHIW
jgi:hypothetical protein